MERTLLVARDVTVLRDGKRIVDGATVTLEAASMLTIQGGSGSGKSTLLRTLVGLLPPLGGEVRVLGEPLYALDPDARRALLRRTGTAFQQDALFGAMTVADNIALPLRELTSLPAAIVDEMVRL